MDTKRLGHVEIKDEAKGEFSAIIATYGVIDSDGDVTLPGAHQDGQKVVVSPYGHSSMRGELPVGAGVVQTDAKRTVVKGHYFMDIPEARSAFLTMKNLHDRGIGEWSYGYEVIDSEMGEKDGQRVRFLKSQSIFEASHVLRGAGVGTRTLSAKDAETWVAETRERAGQFSKEPTVDEYKAAIKPHGTAVTSRDWDPDAATTNVKDGASIDDLRSVYAYVDPAGDPQSKAAYQFPHHHGVDGPANVRALVVGIAVLNGAHGELPIPEAARKSVYDHLAHHLRHADREPPELRPLGGELKLHEEAIRATGVVSGYLESAERVAALRAEKGKALSQINMEALDWVGEDLDRMVKQHADLVRRLRDTPREAAALELARFIHLQRHRSAS